MEARLVEIAEACLRGAEADLMSFPDIVGALVAAGFESYEVDFRRATATYYRLDGDSILLATRRHSMRIAEKLDSERLIAAIRQAQGSDPDYTYCGFCKRAMAAGCAGYIASFSGRRVLYYGRKAETHVEHFPET